MTAQQERAQIIHNAEAAYRKGQITAADLLMIRIVTAKYLLKG